MRLVDGFELRQMEDCYVAVPTGALTEKFPQPIQMNETGARVWRLLSTGERTREELVNHLADCYEEYLDILEKDVDVLLDFAREYDLLVE